MLTKTKTDATTDLRGKIADLDTKRLTLMGERDELSYSAVVERNSVATKRIAEISAELSQLADEKATLTAALSEAGRRDAAARAAERDGKERDDAEKALALLETFAQRGAALDRKFDELIAEYTALSDEFRQLDKLKYAPTTYPLVRITMRTAMLTKLMGTDLKVEHLAPGERKTFGGAIEGWASSVRNRANARLSKSKTNVGQRVISADPGAFRIDARPAALTKVG
jgi:hypothetical protein